MNTNVILILIGGCLVIAGSVREIFNTPSAQATPVEARLDHADDYKTLQGTNKKNEETIKMLLRALNQQCEINTSKERDSAYNNMLDLYLSTAAENKRLREAKSSAINVYGAKYPVDLPPGGELEFVKINKETDEPITIRPTKNNYIVRDGTIQPEGVAIVLSGSSGKMVYLQWRKTEGCWVTLGYVGTLSQGD
jgi:hypothetical protein